MTDDCITFSNKLSKFFQTSMCDDITTENLIHAWIKGNDAEDIYDTLLIMSENIEENYEKDVQKKLIILAKRIENDKQKVVNAITT